MVKKKKPWRRHGRLTLVVLVTWDAEIRRILVQSHPRQLFLRDLISKVTTTKNRLEKKIDWRRGSRSRVHALQEKNTDFKPQSYLKQKTKNIDLFQIS
jgi:hypothetical protein